MKTRFDRLRETSVKIDTTTTQGVEVKRQWFKKRRIGEWREEWRGGSVRTDSYYRHYDQHIRAWIPQYEVLSNRVAKEVIKHVSGPHHLARGRSVIGEIGVGTGAVTQLVARWADAVGKAEIQPFYRYICVDIEDTMIQATERAIKPFAGKHRFESHNGTDFAALRAALPGRKYDVICGSLILHYVNRRPEEGWGWLADTFEELLGESGVAVFGGCFFDAASEDKKKQLQSWVNWMTTNGLHQSVAQRFVDQNWEMSSMSSHEEVMAPFKAKFECRYEPIDRKRELPFGVLLMRRKETLPVSS
jgi:hypothetical protein